MSPKIRPGGISKSSPCRISLRPKRFLRPLAETMGADALGVAKEKLGMASWLSRNRRWPPPYNGSAAEAIATSTRSMLSEHWCHRPQAGPLGAGHQYDGARRMADILDYCEGQKVVRFESGEVMIPEGARLGKLFVLIEGQIEVIRRDTQV